MSEVASKVTRGLEQRQSTTKARARKALEGRGSGNWVSRLLPFLGPAFIASVAYIDPGNFATNIEAGARFNYTLLWVIVASNLMAMLIQAMSAKLGIASGKNLAELCGERYSQPVAVGMWVIMEIVAIATDLAEFLGAALGFNLLFGIPLWQAGLITGVATFIILGLENYGFRPLEAVITTLVGIVAVSYLIETVLDKPDWVAVMQGAFIPAFQGAHSLYLAAGILGATVMPHAIFLHSALTQDRIKTEGKEQKRRLFRFEIIDVLIAMGLAGLVNAAMLIMAAATFFRNGMTDIATIEEAHRTLEPLLGTAASWVFALSLLASGLSSASVGTMAGQIIMQGFLQRKIPVWVRRLVTMIPSLVVIGMGLDPTTILVLSQVVLSFGLPIAVYPLWQFTRDGELMGALVNHKITTLLLGIILTVIVVLNVTLLVQTLTGG
ncbi:MAG: Nramp family divalent metal transporter [Anaerolineales bacterium]